jgi:D-alanyl-D-alanine carboxypeptidase/D-alanyl-D-alanine-endopeptidase (penicillin-binding protein 4)
MEDRIGRPVYSFEGPSTWLNNLRTVHSRPVDSMFRPMMFRSDNFFAEQTLLMVSNERLGRMNDVEIIDTLLNSDLKGLPQRPNWVDGSGLSRYNLFSPEDFVWLLNQFKNEFGLDRMMRLLPTGGLGTLSSRYKQDSGRIYAKTGSLSDVITLSGYLITHKNRLLIFSILVNNSNASGYLVRNAMENFVSGIIRNY